MDFGFQLWAKYKLVFFLRHIPIHGINSTENIFKVTSSIEMGQTHALVMGGFL